MVASRLGRDSLLPFAAVPVRHLCPGTTSRTGQSVIPPNSCAIKIVCDMGVPLVVGFRGAWSMCRSSLSARVWSFERGMGGE